MQNDRAVPSDDDIAGPSVKTHAVDVCVQMLQCLIVSEPPRCHFAFQELCNPNCRVDHRVQFVDAVIDHPLLHQR